MRLVLRKAKVFEPLAKINRGDVLIEIDWFNWNAKLKEYQRAGWMKPWVVSLGSVCVKLRIFCHCHTIRPLTLGVSFLLQGI